MNGNAHSYCESVTWADLHRHGMDIRGRFQASIDQPFKLTTKNERCLGFFVPLPWFTAYAEHMRSTNRDLDIESLSVSALRKQFHAPLVIFTEDDRYKAYIITLSERHKQEAASVVLVSGFTISKIRDLKARRVISLPEPPPSLPEGRNFVKLDSELFEGVDNILDFPSFYGATLQIKDWAAKGFATLRYDKRWISLPTDLARQISQKAYPERPVEDSDNAVFEDVPSPNLKRGVPARTVKLLAEDKFESAIYKRMNVNNGSIFVNVPGYLGEFIDFGQDGYIRGLDENAIQQGIDFHFPLKGYLRSDFSETTEIFVHDTENRALSTVPAYLPDGQAAIIQRALEKLKGTAHTLSLFGKSFNVVGSEDTNKKLRGSYPFTTDINLPMAFNLNLKGRTENMQLGEQPDEMICMAVHLARRINLKVNGTTFHLVPKQ